MRVLISRNVQRAVWDLGGGGGGGGQQMVHPQQKANQHDRQYGTRVPCDTAGNVK